MDAGFCLTEKLKGACGAGFDGVRERSGTDYGENG
jgi:hypothetical protein